MFIFTSNIWIHKIKHIHKLHFVTEFSFRKIRAFVDKTDNKSMYLFKKVHVSFYDFQHVGCDLIRVFDGTDIVCKQYPLTLTQHEQESFHFVTGSRENAHLSHITHTSLKPIMFQF